MVKQLERDLPELLNFYSFPNRSGANCGRPMQLKEALSKSDGGPDQW
jgi:hypothetical protein